MRENLIFFIAVIIIVVVLLTAGQIGHTQDLKMQQTYATYQNAVKLIENQQGEKAIPYLVQLSKDYPGRHNVHHKLGVAYSQAGIYKEAEKQFEIALNLRPALIMQPLFNAQYGEVVYYLKQYEKSKAFFLESIRTGITGDLRTYVDQMLERIASVQKASVTQ